MSEPVISAEVIRPPLQLVRLPVDKPRPAVAFLQSRSHGVMDLIAHFWERLAQTPPLQRPDFHLVVATPIHSETVNINVPQLDPGQFSGAMLYVPRGHRADVLALDPQTAAAFAGYISHQGPKVVRAAPLSAAAVAEQPAQGTTLPLTDLSVSPRNGGDASEIPAEPHATATSANERIPIDFLTGDAESINWMTPLLLPLVHKRSPAQQLVNVVMQLPTECGTEADPHVRVARESDVPVLNKWRRLYKEERGILFDADMDALVHQQRVFVYEIPNGAEAAASNGSSQSATTTSTGTIVAVAKFDLELQDLVEIGGVYTFPEYRNRGYGAGIVRDMAHRVRQAGKMPTLQVDQENAVALHLYQAAGWRELGKLARVWLTG